MHTTSRVRSRLLANVRGERRVQSQVLPNVRGRPRIQMLTERTSELPFRTQLHLIYDLCGV